MQPTCFVVMCQACTCMDDIKDIENIDELKHSAGAYNVLL